VRADALDQLWSKLRDRELLPTMPMVRTFAAAVGLKGLTSTKRDQAVTELLEQLVGMPLDEVERLMAATVVEDRKLGDEYDRWVRLIIGHPPTGAEAPDVQWEIGSESKDGETHPPSWSRHQNVDPAGDEPPNQ
jgi:hypothetical protein